MERAIAVLLLIGSCSSAAAIDLPESCRVRNRGPNCAFANLATLGHRFGNQRLMGLAPLRRLLAAPLGTDVNVRAKLKAINVPNEFQDHYSYDRELLEQANERGCIVSFKPGTLWCGRIPLRVVHSALLTRYDETSVEFFCPDNPQQLWTASRAWFDAGWMGNSLVITEDQPSR